jgi:hypothetical protein
MVPHVDTDTLLAELYQRRHEAAMKRLATAYNRSHERRTGRLRWALGTALLEMGVRVLGDQELARSTATSGC